MGLNLASIIFVTGRLFDGGPMLAKHLFIFGLVAIAAEPILQQLPRSSTGHFCNTVGHQKFDTVHRYQDFLLPAR
jgi:hypothetical protein